MAAFGRKADTNISLISKMARPLSANRSLSPLLPAAKKVIHQTDTWNTEDLSDLVNDSVTRVAIGALGSIQNNIPSVQGDFLIMEFSFAH